MADIPKPTGIDLNDPNIRKMIEDGITLTSELRQKVFPIFNEFLKSNLAKDGGDMHSKIVFSAIMAGLTDIAARTLVVCAGENSGGNVDMVVNTFSYAFPTSVSNVLAEAREAREGARKG